MKYLARAFIIFFVFSFATPLKSQNFYLGIIGGKNFANIILQDPNVVYNNMHQELSTRHTFGIGSIFGLSLNKNISLQLEPMYLEKGSLVSEEVDLEIKYSFLEIPLLLKLTAGKKIRPYIFAGPALNFMLNSEWEISQGGSSLKGDAGSISRKFDLGIIIGTGISIPFWKGSLFLNCRYNLGLSDLSRSGTIEFSQGDFSLDLNVDEADKIKSEVFQIMFGFVLPLGKK